MFVLLGRWLTELLSLSFWDAPHHTHFFMQLSSFLIQTQHKDGDFEVQRGGVKEVSLELFIKASLRGDFKVTLSSLVTPKDICPQ